MTLISHRKQLISILMLFVLAFTVVLPAAHPEEADAANISIYVNGKYLSTDQPPVIQDGRTMVPLRAIFEALGATVEWFGDTQTISGYDPKTNRIMSLVVNQRTMFCADYTLFQVYEANPTSRKIRCNACDQHCAAFVHHRGLAGCRTLQHSPW